MAFMVKDRRRQDEYANYEQQLPDREICYRQANMNSQQGLKMPDRNYGVNSQYAQQSYGYQQNVAPRFVTRYYQDQVDR